MGKIRDWCLSTGDTQSGYWARESKVSASAIKPKSHRLPSPYNLRTGQHERDVQKAMAHALSMAGIWNCRLEGSGKLVSLPSGERKLICSDMTGMPDLIAVRQGRLIAIECKASGGSLSAAQYAKLLELTKAGALVMVVVDVSKAMERLLHQGALATCVMDCGLQVF